MVAHQPNPDNENSDGISPVMYDQGWRAKTTETVEPPHRHRTRRALGRRSRGDTIPLDAYKDPFKNPQASEYSPEQQTDFHTLAQMRGPEVIAALHKAKADAAEGNAHAVSASPEEVERQHQEVAEDWYERELGINDDTTLFDLNSDRRFWLTPEEMAARLRHDQ
jgi:hypothetical protein